MKKCGEYLLRGERGSVMMEFVIVLPIYFLLLGFAFVVGELSLHSIHLSASGDRNVAFAANTDSDFWRLLKQVLSLDRTAVADRDKDAPDHSYAGDEVYQGRASVSKFNEAGIKEQNKVFPKENGHWTDAVAGRAVDNYTLSPVTRGIIAHWFYETERRVYDGNLMSEKHDHPERNAIDDILDKDHGTLGRAEMKGNYYEDNEGKKIREYGYFSLRRSQTGRYKDAGRKSYRYWRPSELAADDNWKMAALHKDDGGSDDYAYHEKTATVKLDPELYVAEASMGARLEKATGDPSSSDGGVSYDFLPSVL